MPKRLDVVAILRQQLREPQGHSWATAPSRPGAGEIGTHWTPPRRKHIRSGSKANCGGTAGVLEEIAALEEEVAVASAATVVQS
jgi:hypothetical protein